MQRPMYFHDNISLNSSYCEKFFRQICRENRKRILCPKTFFWKLYYLLDNVENMVEPDRPQMTI